MLVGGDQPDSGCDLTLCWVLAGFEALGFDKQVHPRIDARCLDHAAECGAITFGGLKRDIVDQQGAEIVDDDREPNARGIDFSHTCAKSGSLLQHQELAEPRVKAEAGATFLQARMIAATQIQEETNSDAFVGR